MSLEVNIGKRGNILEIGPQNADQVFINFRISLHNDLCKFCFIYLRDLIIMLILGHSVKSCTE